MEEGEEYNIISGLSDKALLTSAIILYGIPALLFITGLGLCLLTKFKRKGAALLALGVAYALIEWGYFKWKTNIVLSRYKDNANPMTQTMKYKGKDSEVFKKQEFNKPSTKIIAKKAKVQDVPLKRKRPKIPCTLKLPVTAKCRGEGCQYNGGYASNTIDIFEIANKKEERIGRITKCEIPQVLGVSHVVQKFGLQGYNRNSARAKSFGLEAGDTVHILRSIGEGLAEICIGSETLDAPVNYAGVQWPKVECWLKIKSKKSGTRGFVECSIFDLAKPKGC